MRYDLFRALHVVSAMGWTLGLLCLPLVFQFHADAEKGSRTSETFKVMERRLLRGIMNPSMVLVWLFGIALTWKGEWWYAGWWQVDVALTVALTGVHYLYSRWRKDFAADRNVRLASFYRWWNAAPATLIVAIVLLVYLKPL
jgi:protoporphyrinogen IX oxidase